MEGFDAEEYDLNFDDEFYDPAAETSVVKMDSQEDLDCETLPKEEVENVLKAEAEALSDIIKTTSSDTCLWCKQSPEGHNVMMGPVCGHQFCKGCWKIYCTNQIQGGVSSISCVVSGCTAMISEDFVFSTGVPDELLETYKKTRFNDAISSHYQMHFCPGENCDMIFRARVPQAKRVTCHRCGTSFCFQCRLEYHAPASCETMNRWLAESNGRRIAVHSSGLMNKQVDCPNCRVCVERVEGCNRTRCSFCSFYFCWICLGDWSAGDSHNCNQYEASVKHMQLAAEKNTKESNEYSFDFKRWKSHAASRELEKRAAEEHISLQREGRMSSTGASETNWQLLCSAMACLEKCRHTLQYTYPIAYYMMEGPEKDLFKFQQGQFEAEVKNLAWSIEQVGSRTDQEIRTRMKTAENWRGVLLAECSKSAPASSKQ